MKMFEIRESERTNPEIVVSGKCWIYSFISDRWEEIPKGECRLEKSDIKNLPNEICKVLQIAINSWDEKQTPDYLYVVTEQKNENLSVMFLFSTVRTEDFAIERPINWLS